MNTKPLRSLKTAMVAAGMLALSIGIPAAAGVPAASAATTPVLYANGSGGWGNPAVRPAWILIGQGGSPWVHVGKWSTWDKGEPHPHASANATLWVDNCVPNCAQGKETAHRVVVTLSTVQTHRGARYYSKMTWYTPGYRLPGYRTSTAVLHYSPTASTVPFWH